MDENTEQEVQDIETIQDTAPEEPQNHIPSQADKFIPANEAPVSFKKTPYNEADDQYAVTQRLLRKSPIQKKAA